MNVKEKNMLFVFSCFAILIVAILFIGSGYLEKMLRPLPLGKEKQEIKNKYEFIGWYNDTDSLVSSDLHNPCDGNFQTKDSVLTLTAKFKNVK